LPSLSKVCHYDGDELGFWRPGANHYDFDDYMDALMPPAEFLALGAASRDFKQGGIRFMHGKLKLAAKDGQDASLLKIR
jgi:hypothetical protein